MDLDLEALGGKPHLKLVRKPKLKYETLFGDYYSQVGGLKDIKTRRIYWCNKKRSSVVIPFDGIPFLYVAEKRLQCQQGKGRKKAKKQDRTSKTNDYCPVVIVVQQVLKFPQFKITTSNTKWHKDKITKAIRQFLKEKPLEADIKFYTNLPDLGEHKHHKVKADVHVSNDGDDGEIPMSVDQEWRRTFAGLLIPDELSCLNEGEKLNDFIIDASLQYILFERSPNTPARVHIMSTYFFYIINKRTVKIQGYPTRQKTDREVWESAKGYTNRVDLRSKDYTFIPANVGYVILQYIISSISRDIG
ncbi:Sentrin-specific protease 6 [Exaiptasia diaphana]|nr:Sentrin-specific protease 6 [Exaiptasia diaphana]